MAGTVAETSGMILHEPVSFESNDGKSTCVGDLWVPDGEVKGTVQIMHGMVEHIGRYEEFALKLCHRGYAVCGIDHIGHGRSCPDEALRGVFDPETGADSIIEDQHTLRQLIYPRFAGKPYFTMGHSMGSFINSCYITRHGGGLAGAIVMGNAWQPYPMIHAAKLLAKTIALTRGWNHRSDLLNALGVGGYNKEFEGTEGQTGYEWLSRDEPHVRAYAEDPACGWIFSVSGYYMLFKLFEEWQNSERLACIPPSLPILIIAGSEDPVGEKGAGPARAFRAFKEAGVRDVELEIRDGDRHELLGELDREEVMEKLISWIEAHTA